MVTHSNSTKGFEAIWIEGDETVKQLLEGLGVVDSSTWLGKQQVVKTRGIWKPADTVVLVTGGIEVAAGYTGSIRNQDKVVDRRVAGTVDTLDEGTIPGAATVDGEVLG